MTSSPSDTDKSLADQVPGSAQSPAPSVSERPSSKRPSDQAPDSREQQALLAELPEWRISFRQFFEQRGGPKEPCIQRTFHFDQYADALQFTANIGVLADQYQHYPTIITAFKKVTVFWHSAESAERHTGKPAGLQKKDFILAAKTDALITRA